ncbi:hypothetical protein DXG01_003337 [Tephrocybe rancida]|nr:hypothetical protein DXG01_003337 [Tephrocybe rancida]
MDSFVNLATTSTQVTTGGGALDGSKHLSFVLEAVTYEFPPVDLEAILTRAIQTNPSNVGTFAAAVQFLTRINLQEELATLDHESISNAWSQVYDGKGPSSVDAKVIGQAVVSEAFTKAATAGGVGTVSDFVSSAMDLASKKFDQSGSPSGTKQEAVNAAALTALQFFANLRQ